MTRPSTAIPMTRPCDAIGCGASVAAGRFMCLAHWRQVPTATQRAINAGYRRAPNGRALLTDSAYVEACAAAIEHLADLEHQPRANSYRRLADHLRAKAPAA